MKKRTFISVLSMILVLIMLLSEATLLISCGNDEQDGGDTTGGDTTDNTDITDDNEIDGAVPLFSSDKQAYLANAKFTSEIPSSPDGLALPSFCHMTKDESATSESVGFLWNAETLSVLVDVADLETVAINVGSYKKCFSAGDGLFMKNVKFTDTGILPSDIGQLIPVAITATAGDSTYTFNGYVQLADYEIVFSSSCDSLDDFTKHETKADVKPAASVAGIEAKNGSIRLYDKFEDYQGQAYTENLLEARDIAGLNEFRNYIFETVLTVDSLPQYSPDFVTKSMAYGLYFNFVVDSSKDSPLFSIINISGELTFILFGDEGSEMYPVKTGKKLGETFHMSVIWTKDNAITLAIDGKEIATFENAAATRTIRSKSLRVVTQRNASVPMSDADNIDVSIHSICLSYDNSESIMASLDAEKILGAGNVVKLDGTDAYLLSKDLTTHKSITSEKYGITANFKWESSNEAILTNEGKFTKHAGSGELFTLTAKLVNGDSVLSSKTLTFFSKGAAPEGKVYRVKNDTNPFESKSGNSQDSIFTLDQTLNSVTYDMGKVTKINRVTLTSITNIGSINKNLISLYYSNDNLNFTYIDNFSVFQSGNNVYLYNFNVEARYIKVHSTANSNYDDCGKITNSLQKIIFAEYAETPILSDKAFAKNTTVKVENTKNEIVYDYVASFTLEELGINAADLKADMSDIRFMQGDLYLPYYLMNDTFFVRVFEIAAKASADIKVLYGSENAESMSNGHETFEIQYGTKYGWEYQSKQAGWECSIAEMPNGDLLSAYPAGNVLRYYRSTDGGMTWSALQTVSNVKTQYSFIVGGGFIVDKENNKVFHIGLDYSGNPKLCKFLIAESNDSGKTWTNGVYPTGGTHANDYAITYSDGITLSCEDGTGPNVDYVFTTGICPDTTTGEFYTTSVYSKDGGKTWSFSETLITYHKDGEANAFMEGGCSEDCVYEQDDGTLVFYARCQVDGVTRFMVAYSKDHGVTWGDTKFSSFHTSNTQPIMEDFNGSPVFLWGGNNTIGGRSYVRYPLNLAVSYDQGDTFEDIINVSFQTEVDTLSRNSTPDQNNQNVHMNPDLVFYKYQGIDCVYITSTYHKIYVYNADDFLYKTKGAFDSFEDGLVFDGWQFARGGASTTTVGATDGEKALSLLSNSVISRSLHYIEKGYISFDLFVGSFTELDIELQAGFNDQCKRTYKANNEQQKLNAPLLPPVALSADETGSIYYLNESGVKTPLGLSLKTGNNTVKIDFDGEGDTVNITVNGESKSIAVMGEDINVSFFTVFTSASSGYSIDRFIAVKED